jgi:KDO2-lipid IV(A) lauroyltransferase
MPDTRPRLDFARFLGPKFWPHWLALGAMRLCAALPLPLTAGLAALLGELTYRLGRRRRRIARRNLERCLPGYNARARQHLLRAHFRALVLALLTNGLPWWASRRRLQRLVRWRDRHHYDEALAAGRNVILMMPHFVALEIAMVLSIERPMVFMYQRLKNPLMNAALERGRMRFGAELVERDANLKGLVRKIKTGTPMIYLPDQNPGARRGLFVPFFGIEVATHPALSRFARLTDAVVIPLICKQLPRGRGYELVFKPPLENFPGANPEADTLYMNRIIEDAIRALPAQYFWVHRRFKVRPPGEPDFYA